MLPGGKNFTLPPYPDPPGSLLTNCLGLFPLRLIRFTLTSAICKVCCMASGNGSAAIWYSCCKYSTHLAYAPTSDGIRLCFLGSVRKSSGQSDSPFSKAVRRRLNPALSYSQEQPERSLAHRMAIDLKPISLLKSLLLQHAEDLQSSEAKAVWNRFC